jgi:hypothetical protein
LCKYFLETTNNILSKETVTDLFGEQAKIEFVNKYNFGGFDNHGDYFILYQYKIENCNINLLNNQLPQFKKGYFKDTQLTNVSKVGKWKKWPLNSQIDSIMFNSTFDFKEVADLVESKFVNDSSNLFSYISNKYLGNCFLLLNCNEKKLFIVLKTN